MAIKKLCSHGSCHKVIEGEEKYCIKHQAQHEANEKERYKEYKKRRGTIKEKKKQQDFYNSSSWLRLRAAVIAGCYGIDIYEYYTTGRIIQGQSVHHIIEVDEDWDSRLDILNLIYISEQNHRKIHAEYNKSITKRKEIQKKLFKIIEKFEIEFKC
ncbi:MAG: hypothetical protein ACRC68_04335 [Clostridium sp.]